MIKFNGCINIAGVAVTSEQLHNSPHCRANVADKGYEPCGYKLRVLSDGTYSCRKHGRMLA